MKFQEFAQILYSYIGNNENTGSFTRTLFLNATDYAQSESNPLDEYEPAAYRAFYSGRRSIGSLSKKIMNHFEPSCFVNFLEERCSDEQAANLAEEFSNQGYPVETMQYAEDITTILKNIILSSTKRNIANDGLQPYFQYLSEKYYKIKTLLYFNEPKPIYDFYVPNDIYSPEDFGHKRRLRTELLLLSFRQRFVVITGTGGIGKSMLMRYLTLTLVKKYERFHKIPIMIELKEFDSETMTLAQYMKERIHVPNLEKYLKAGKCVLLLDGMDEIKSRFLSNFEEELSELANRYPENNFILSSRPITNFITLNKFEIYELAPFTKEQAIELIDRLVYRPESPELKDNFRKEIDRSLYDSHRDFVENPLLLTIMLMTYERYAHIPAKRHIFYRDAFYTLAEKHDATKISFKRAYKTGLTPEEFAAVLEEFCSRTYFDEKFTFTEAEFEKYFNHLRVRSQLSKKIRFSDLKTDLTVNLCIMCYDSGKYSFIHRSFQEYFCAVRMSKGSDASFSKVSTFFEERKNRLTEDYTFEMFYDLAPERVEHLIFLPFLTDLFQKCDRGKGETDMYWNFLEAVYPEINYSVGEVPSAYFNLPDSYIYDVILHKKGVDRRYLRDLPLDKQYVEEKYVRIEEDGKTQIVPAGEVIGEACLDYKKIEISGYNLIFQTKKVREESSELHDALESTYFPFRLEWIEMRRILQDLQNGDKADSFGLYDDIFEV